MINSRVLAIVSIIGLYGVFTPDRMMGQEAQVRSRLFRVGTVDFVSGALEDQCGCPSVMIRNREQHAVLIMTSQLDDQLAGLIKLLEDKNVNSSNTHGHCVFLPAMSHRTEDAQSAIEDRLKLFARKCEIQSFMLSVKRSGKQTFFRMQGVDSKTAHSVYLFIDGEVASSWNFEAAKLDIKNRTAIQSAVNRCLKDRSLLKE